MSKAINRRNFIKGAGVAAIATAVAATVPGCASESQQTSDGQQADAGQQWDEEYDIVIVGSGGAGYVAAVEAAANDPEAKIHIIEKMSNIGGSSILSGGNIGSIFTDVQEEAAKTDPFYADDSLDLYFEDKMATGDYRSDPELVRIYVDNAHDNYEWLRGFGINWSYVAPYGASTYIPSDPSVAGVQSMSDYIQVYDENGCFADLNRKGRWVCGPVYGDKKGGYAILSALQDHIEENCPNVDVVTEVAMKSIVREGIISGNVIGIVADSGSDEVRIKANRAVILTCGGFSANPEMLHKYNPKIDLSVQPLGGRGNTGDGLIAAGFVGAQTANMTFIQIDVGMNANSGSDHYSASSLPFGGPTCINLDSKGKRFWGEMGHAAQYSDAKLTVLSSNNMVTYWTLGDANSVADTGTSEEDIAAFEEMEKGFAADTLEEMAEKIGCDAATLKSTVDTYNGFVDAGVDTDFGKSATYLVRKIDTPPFYAYETGYICSTTPGGLAITANGHVLDLNGEEIPHLYAAGEVTGNLHGMHRNTGGDSWADIACFGRIAGASAANDETVV